MSGVSSGGTAAWSYTFDCENRMVTSSELSGGGGTDTNIYNGLGCRVANHDFAGTYTNMTDGVDATSPVLDNGVEKYTPGFSSEDLTDGGANYYTEPDQIGSSLGMMSATESQIYGVEYDAFGDIVGTSGTFPDSYAFMDGYAGTNGYQTDRDTGFIRCGNRFYSPYFGRFNTQDPTGTGMNWYDYSDNNPTEEIDPDGLDYQSAFSYWLSEGAPSGDSVKETVTTISPDGSKSSVITLYQMPTYGVTSAYGNTMRAASTGPGRYYRVSFSVNFNIAIAKVFARSHSILQNRLWLRAKTQDGSVGDYKDLVDRKEDKYLYKALEMGGNFNFGAMAAAMGESLDEALADGEIAHLTGSLGAGTFFNNPLHPDSSQEAIVQGYNYYSSGQYLISR